MAKSTREGPREVLVGLQRGAVAFLGEGMQTIQDGHGGKLGHGILLGINFIPSLGPSLDGPDLLDLLRLVVIRLLLGARRCLLLEGVLLGLFGRPRPLRSLDLHLLGGHEAA